MSSVRRVIDTRLRDLYGNISVHATAHREHEAVIDLLLLVMHADQHVSGAELDSIRSISEDSGFETDTFSFDQYFGAAVAKVRAAIAADEVGALLDSIDERITSSVLRHSVFSAAHEVATADASVDPPEDEILAQIAARFA